MAGQPDDPASKIPFRRILPIYLLFLLVVLLALELAARWLLARSPDPTAHVIVRDYARRAAGDQPRFEGAPYLNYRLTPGFIEDFGPGQRTRHNAQGFRDNRDFAPKPPGSLRILCVGGSTTYGVGVRDNSETFPAKLERLLREEQPGAGPVEVFNLGVGGYTSAEVVTQLHFQGLQLEPDLVLIHCAINDVAPRFYDNFKCDYSHFRTMWTERQPTWAMRLAGRSHFALWAGWKLHWLEPLTLQARTQRPLPTAGTALANLKRNGTRCFRHNLEAAITLVQAARAQAWLLTQPYLEDERFAQPTAEARLLEVGYRQGLQEHNAIVREVGQDRRVPVIDLDQMLPRHPQLFTDPIHMTPEGNRITAGLIAQRLNQGRTPN